MKNQAMNELDQVKGKMVVDFKTMIADSEELLRAVAAVSDQGFAGARTKFEEKLSNAKRALAGVSQPVFDRARKTATGADDYVHGNPWTAIGVAAAAGALIGFLSARR